MPSLSNPSSYTSEPDWYSDEEVSSDKKESNIFQIGKKKLLHWEKARSGDIDVVRL